MKTGSKMRERQQQSIERKHRLIGRAVARAEKAEEEYNWKACLLAGIEAAITREGCEGTGQPYSKRYRSLHRMAQSVRRTLVRLEARKAASANASIVFASPVSWRI